MFNINNLAILGNNITKVLTNTIESFANNADETLHLGILIPMRIIHCILN